MHSLNSLDIAVFLLYFVVVTSYGYYVYRKKRRTEVDSADFFLAEGSLTWWAIGASLIASNISAEQFIGMSGNGFTVGIAVAAYEWIAAISLIVLAVFFLPIYLKNHIFTMPQFLKMRYNETVAMIMAVFWLVPVCVREPDVDFVPRCAGDQQSDWAARVFKRWRSHSRCSPRSSRSAA